MSWIKTYSHWIEYIHPADLAGINLWRKCKKKYTFFDCFIRSTLKVICFIKFIHKPFFLSRLVVYWTYEIEFFSIFQLEKLFLSIWKLYWEYIKNMRNSCCSFRFPNFNSSWDKVITKVSKLQKMWNSLCLFEYNS